MAFARNAGVSRPTINQALDGKPVNKESADAIAQTVGMKTPKAFSVTTQGEPLAPASVIAYHRTLSSILGKAVKWEYIQINPADAAEKPCLGPHEAPFLEEADARRLLELLQAEPIRWWVIITFDLLSSLCRQEFLGLCWAGNHTAQSAFGCLWRSGRPTRNSSAGPFIRAPVKPSARFHTHAGARLQAVPAAEAGRNPRTISHQRRRHRHSFRGG